MWFDANYMKSNQTKCHFMIASPSSEEFWIQVGEQIIWESRQEKLLGVKIDKGLNGKWMDKKDEWELLNGIIS